MARPIRTVVYLIAIVAVLVALADRHPPRVAKEDDTPAEEQAVRLAFMEDALASLRRDVAAEPTTIVAIGDSSLLANQVVVRREQTLKFLLEQDAPAHGLQLRVVAYRGFDDITYYMLADELVATGTRTVMLIANLQAFADSWFTAPRLKHPELAAFLGLGRVPEALALPLERAGFAASSLVTLPLLRTLGLSDAPTALRDYRDLFRERLATGLTAEAGAAMAEDTGPTVAAPPPSPQPEAGAVAPPGAGASPGVVAPPGAPRAVIPRRGAGAMGRPPRPAQAGVWATSPFRRTDLYPDHLRPDAASVRVFAAAVRRITRGGTRVVVLMLPVHLQALQLTGIYARADIDGAIAVVRAASEASGAAVLDLTHVLPQERYFADGFSHFTEEGARIVAAETLKQLAAALAASRSAREEPRPR